MARQIWTDQDHTQHSINNAAIQVLASAPGTPVAGQMYFDSVLGTLRIYNGTSWDNYKPSTAAAGSIPNTALATNPLARANHTGSQLAATISDFDAQVRTSRIDQMTPPSAAVAFNAQKITGLADPTAAQDGATKNYVDGAVQSAAAGIDSKPSVRVVATSNITLSGTQTIDGVSLVVGDRVLAQNQTTASQNGVYVVASGAWSRATDADQNSELTPGAFWFVEEGTTNNKTQWRVNNSGTITIGTTSITITQFGAAASYTASNGVQLVGNDFSIKLPASPGLVADSNGLKIDTAVVMRRYETTVGDGSTTAFTVTHSLNTRGVHVQVYRNSSPYDEIDVEVARTTVNAVTVTITPAPTTNQFSVVVMG